MQLIGTMLVFLGLACAGFLGGLFVLVVRFARSTAEQHAEVMEAAEQQHRELRSQLTATTATILDRVQLVAGGLAAQLQATAAEQRNDLRLAGLLPPPRVPGEEPRGPGEEPRGETRSATTPPNGSPAARTSTSRERAITSPPGEPHERPQLDEDDREHRPQLDEDGARAQLAPFDLGSEHRPQLARRAHGPELRDPVLVRRRSDRRGHAAGAALATARAAHRAHGHGRAGIGGFPSTETPTPPYHFPRERALGTGRRSRWHGT